MLQEPTHAGPTPNDPDPSGAGAARCVLVVRSEALHDRIGAAVAGSGAAVSVESSPSYLSAMGRLVGVQPDVVIGPVSAMTGMVSSTARALRKLCPRARLVVVAQPDERAEAQAALDAGFDQCVYEPADASTLLAAVGFDPAHRQPDTTAQERAALQDAPTPGPTTDDTTNGNSAWPQHSDAPQDAPLDASAPRAAAESEPESEAEHADDRASNAAPDAGRVAGSTGDADLPEALGDIDLVEALMQDQGDLRTRAERLLHEQSGIAGVVLSRSADQVHPDHAVVPVQYEGRPMGLLHAPHPASAEQLAPWADWVAHWLALEAQMTDLRRLAMTDELTGVWNRRYFQQFLERRLDEAGRDRQQVTLLVFDIDDFKQYNDNYGHPAGDEILRETARLIQSLVRDHDVVARIGGDEFAVVFWDKGEPRHLGSQHPDNVLAIARRFQKAICSHQFPKLGKEAVGRLTVSGGLAGFPWDGRTPEELIEQADAMALQSKRSGKNAVCFGPGATPNGNGNGGKA